MASTELCAKQAATASVSLRVQASASPPLWATSSASRLGGRSASSSPSVLGPSSEKSVSARRRSGCLADESDESEESCATRSSSETSGTKYGRRENRAMSAPMMGAPVRAKYRPTGTPDSLSALASMCSTEPSGTSPNEGSDTENVVFSVATENGLRVERW